MSQVSSLIQSARQEVRHTLADNYGFFYGALVSQFGERCAKCGAGGKIQIDHIAPVAQGGASELWNLQLLCAACNNAKGNRLQDFRANVAPAAKTPRPYQLKALDAIEAASARGVKRPIVEQATGLGKTYLAANLIKRRTHLGRALFLAPIDEVVFQNAKAVQAENPGIPVGIVKASLNQKNARIVIASLHTIRKKNRLAMFAPGSFQTVIVDECFPAGTLIDGRPIEQIKVGDWVNCYSHSKHQITRRKVTETMRKPASILVEIVLATGKRIVCTPNHPIYSKAVSEYVPAITLRHGDHVFSQSSEAEGLPNQAENLRHLRQYFYSENMELDNDSTLLETVQPNQLLIEAAKSGFAELRCMRNLGDRDWLEIASAGSQGPRLLLGQVQSGLDIQPLAAKYAYQQSNARPCQYRQDGESDERAHVSGTRRQWPAYSTADSASRSAWLANGNSDCHRASEGALPVPSSLLQGGYWKRGIEACYRSRRPDAQAEEMEVSGSPENGNLECVRVESIEILEPGSDGRFEQVCPDGHVYNFGVEEHHNYFANGILVHNCHLNLDAFKAVIDHVASPDALIVGLSATPFRLDNRGLDEVFDELLPDAQMSLIDGIREGWLCEPVSLQFSLKGADFTNIHSRGGDLDQNEVAEFIRRADNWKEAITEQWRTHAGHLKTAMFVPRVEMAKELADHLRAGGIRAAAIDGKTDKGERRKKLLDYESGQLQVLVNVACLNTGWNSPTTECLLIGTLTASKSRYLQTLGRGTRVLDGVIEGLETAEERLAAIAASSKPNFLVMDLVGVTKRHKLVNLASLAGKEKPLREREGLLDLTAAGERERAAAAAEQEERERIEAEFEARRVSLISGVELPQPAKKAPPAFHWQSSTNSRSTLTIRNHTITVRPMADDNWIATDGQSFRAICATEGECRAAAEAFAKSLLFGKAWEGKPASEKQIALMTRMRIRFAEGISAGEASVLINERFNSKKKAKGVAV